jgi:hypothetical protein
MTTTGTRRFLGGFGLVLTLAACTQAAEPTTHEAPAVVEEIEGSELSRLTLSARAVERLGIETESVGEDGRMLTVPYTAVLYDSDGRAWAYANPEPNVFVRHELMVDRIEGAVAFVADGPPAGTAVVTTGAAELFGTETGVGGGH